MKGEINRHENAITRDTLKSGALAMMKKHPRAWGDFLAGRDDAGTGDVFLQCCLFGEAIYG